ncbi:MAG: hypothetical protein DMD35_02620 [Gemmatimonadetes bacterium]|nr:MAG: hypothetical protein DMD35_02620 [Gemmatimonadota bacterium]
MRTYNRTSALPALSRIALALLAFGLVATAAPAPLHAQAAEGKEKTDKAKKPKEEKEPTGEKTVPILFTAEKPLEITFRTNVKQIRHDKGDESPWRWASLSYKDSTGKSVDVPVKIRTRGIWRLKHCEFPPIRLNFANKDTKGTVFEGLDKPKLVNYCKDNDQYEQYMLQEAQLYRIYQLLTPLSHRVRVAKFAYVDSASGKAEATRYAMILEDPQQLANRHMSRLVKTKGATAADMEPKELALAYMFLYYIGNLDFSFNGLHNTELLGTADGRVLPVAYDFDYAGAVNATYAVPPPNYNVPNVRTRKFMAYCEIAPEFPGAVNKLIENKEAIYALYHDEIGKLMSPSIVNETLRYYDDFYDEVKTQQNAERNIFRNCIRPH